MKVGPLIGEGNTLVSDNEGMTKILNSHFANVFTVENLTVIPHAKVISSREEHMVLHDVHITEMDILQVVSKLSENKAAGVDGLNSTFIKNCIKGLLKPLGKLFKESLDTGEIPEDWRTANVTALFKKGKHCDPGNYRPISLTHQVSKILEKLITKELVSYLEKNKLLLDSQHSFRQNRSCLTNLLDFLEHAVNKLDRGDAVDVFYLDFQKAFDKVGYPTVG